jgi:hypothetical protein
LEGLVVAGAVQVFWWRAIFVILTPFFAFPI